MDFSKQPDDSPKNIRTEDRGTRVPAPDHVDPTMREVDAEVKNPDSLPAREQKGGGVRSHASTESTKRRSDSTRTIPPARSATRDTVSANGKAPARHAERSPGEQSTTREGSGWKLRPRGMEPGRVLERWNHVQSDFVDDPQTSIREADALAAEVAEAVVTELEERRTELRSTWDGTGIEDTETLRLALRDYRSFVRHLSGDSGRT